MDRDAFDPDSLDPGSLGPGSPRPPARLDGPHAEGGRKPPVARLLSAGARGAERVAHAAGVDTVLDEAVEEAIVRALKSPAVRRAIDRAVAEHAFDAQLQAEVVTRIVQQVLASEAAAQVWKEVLASDQAQMLVERIAEAPEVRAAITAQGAGLITDVGTRLTHLTEALDDAVERVVRRHDAESEVNQVGLITRLTAAAADAGLAFVVYALLSGMIGAVLPVTFGGKLALWAIAVLIGLGAAAGLGVIVAFWALVGQTPGMRFLSIRIVHHGSHEIGLRCAVRRMIGTLLALVPGGLGIFAIAHDRDRRGWHDHFADTEVVYDTVRRTAPYSRQRAAGESARQRAD